MQDSLVVADALNPGISADITKDIDITLVPPLRGEGQPRQFADVASHETRRRKKRACPELILPSLPISGAQNRNTGTIN